jgi:hypothetical protein
MTTAEEKIQALRNLLVQAEAQHSQTIVLARKALGEIEDDVRELRREAAKRDTRIFTEAEFAALFKVSPETMARERKAGRIQPLEMGQNVVRYSSLQLEGAHEIFRSRPKLVGERKGTRKAS